MIIFKTTETNQELKDILILQRKNLKENLTLEEQNSQGFVTVKHNFDLLKQMNTYHSHTIAKHNNKVIAYALSMSVKLKNEITILKPMFNEINNIIKDDKYIVMGQICIDKKYRGKGIFKSLYLEMKNSFSTKGFKYIITEIDIKNKRSLNAHKSVGFTTLKDYVIGNKNWRIVSLEI